MNNLLTSGKINAGKIYMVDLLEGEAQNLRILAETPTHIIFVKEDASGCEVFEVDKNKIGGIYEIKDWYENQEK